MSQYNPNQELSTARASLERLLNEKQYVAITGESLATARLNRTLGKGCSFVRLGRSIKYRPQDVLAYIARGLVRTGGPSHIKPEAIKHGMERPAGGKR